MRAVFDTNVLLSAFLWQKGLRPIYQAIRERTIIPCFTGQTLDELKQTLIYPKFTNQLIKIGITPDEILDLLISRTYFTPSLFDVNAIQDDPSDNYFLDCALSAKARFIVSSDKHLLKLVNFKGIPIIKPRVFIIQAL